jgi:hypothetical protein
MVVGGGVGVRYQPTGDMGSSVLILLSIIALGLVFRGILCGIG